MTENNAVGHFEPSLRCAKIPRCPSCEAANPEAASRCANCGAPAPLIAETRHQTSIAANLNHFIPWHARALLAIGRALQRLAHKFKGERQ